MGDATFVGLTDGFVNGEARMYSMSPPVVGLSLVGQVAQPAPEIFVSHVVLVQFNGSDEVCLYPCWPTGTPRTDVTIGNFLMSDTDEGCLQKIDYTKVS